MKTIIERTQDVSEDEFEAASLSTLAEILNDQQETQREALTMLKEVAIHISTALFADNRSQRNLERERLKLEREKFEFHRSQARREATASLSESAKNVSELSKAPLATKSGSGTKSKAKARSTKG